jgi:hypothetical protein
VKMSDQPEERVSAWLGCLAVKVSLTVYIARRPGRYLDMARLLISGSATCSTVSTAVVTHSVYSC